MGREGRRWDSGPDPAGGYAKVLTVRPNVKYQAVLLAAVIDFEGGSRYQCELADVDPKAVAIVLTAGGVHNYFWKARPIR